MIRWFFLLFIGCLFVLDLKGLWVSSWAIDGVLL